MTPLEQDKWLFLCRLFDEGVPVTDISTHLTSLLAEAEKATPEHGHAQ